MSLHIRTRLAAADERVTTIKIPPYEIRTKVFFMIYNMSTDNIEAKGFEFYEVLMEQYYPWFAQYMVMQRVCIDPNFHDICLMFLHKVNSPVLDMEIRKATYANCKVILTLRATYERYKNNFQVLFCLFMQILLRSDIIKSCSGERTLLKNIGSWFGKSAIQWNQDPSTYVDGLIPLIVKAYQKGLMLAVVQFISKILEPCQPIISVGTMEILSLLAEIYTKPDLQLSLEYNIEVLFRDFGVDAKHTKTNYLLKDVKHEVA
uniref:CCR4-NOT transcription complex subunit 1 CAF1-binding domain-containing protein n=2 Tax=Aegilops tauschii subsp. strangulata TaxID=200361 RepID=A0A452Y211_AEGTS